MAEPTAKERTSFAKAGWAMPDGSYYIRPGHPQDLTNAVMAVGRASGSDGTSDEEQRLVVRKHIIKRANQLGRSSALPHTWNPDGTLMTTATHAAVDAFLDHQGVKGMKWGIRHDLGHQGDRAKTSKINKLDKKFENGSFSDVIKIHNSAAQAMNNGIQDRINNKTEYKNADLNDTTSAVAKKYYAESAKAYQDQLNKASVDYGTNASGTKRYQVNSEDGGWTIKTVDVSHASATTYRVKLKLNAKGHIVSLGDPVPDDMSQMDASEFVEHFGVKGMHWGVRKEDGKSSPAETPQGKSSADAARAAKISAKAQTGTHQLTNKELQDLVQRMNLEQQYSKLTSPPETKKIQKGQSFVQKYNNHTQSGITAIKVTKEAIKILGPLLVAGAAAAAASKASGHSGPVRMQKLAIGS